MKTVVFTSDTHSWLLRGFFHQWNKYGKTFFEKEGKWFGDFLTIEVAGFTKPEGLPNDVSFVSIGNFKDYPVEKWSDAIIKYLKGIDDELVLFLLEDYWMMRAVDTHGLAAACGFMQTHKEVIRFDVAADRVFNDLAQYVCPWGSLDICEAKGAYALSFQASIYRRELLLEVMRPSETPWMAEINGSARLNKLSYRVVGSYQWPLNYMIVMNKGKFDRQGHWMFPARSLRMEDWMELISLGYLQAPETAVQP